MIAVATARAGNVLGGGDWAADRVVPDVVRALAGGRPWHLRHPDAVRPWQHVLDPLAGYMLLAERLLAVATRRRPSTSGRPRATRAPSGDSSTGSPKASAAVRAGASSATSAPFRRRRPCASMHRAPPPSSGGRHACALAEGLRWTVEWYAAHAAGEDMSALTRRQLSAYEERGERGAACLPVLRRALRETLVDLGEQPLANAYLRPSSSTTSRPAIRCMPASAGSACWFRWSR